MISYFLYYQYNLSSLWRAQPDLRVVHAFVPPSSAQDVRFLKPDIGYVNMKKQVKPIMSGNHEATDVACICFGINDTASYLCESAFNNVLLSTLNCRRLSLS